MPAYTLPVPAPSRLFWATTLSVLGLLVWDYAPFDLTMARWLGTSSGFAYENHWFWSGVLHTGMRWPPWLLEFALLFAVVKPFGTTRQLPIERRAQLALTTLVLLLMVSTLKLHSHTSCPWELKEFGGVANYVSHWAWGVTDGGSGGCFPGGHASAGFAFVGAYFAYRPHLPTTARRWLWSAVAAGMLLGMAQQVRGAHFMSHTLWTGWLCWAAAALIDQVVSQSLLQKRSPARAQVPDLSALRP